MNHKKKRKCANDIVTAYSDGEEEFMRENGESYLALIKLWATELKRELIKPLK